MSEPPPHPSFSAPSTTERAALREPSVLTEFGGGPRPRERYALHLVLFLATLASMVYVSTFSGGGGLIGRDLAYAAGGWVAQLKDGLLYAIPFLLFLTVHEFGHYLTARRRGVSVTLPFYIPVPLALGTLGAVIRIREPLRRTRVLFDVGAAGPLAGVVVAFGLALVALATLPAPTYLLDVTGHEPIVRSFLENGRWPAIEGLIGPGGFATVYGDTLLWRLLMLLNPAAPPMYELQHYPLLLAAWLGLFFTALNLLPVGQLDGGHVVYALFGPRVHAIVARVTTGLLLVSGALGAGHDLPDILAALAMVTGMSLDMTGPALQNLADGAALAAWPLLAYFLFVLLRRFLDGRVWLALAGALAMTATVWLAVTFAPPVVDALGYTGWLIWSALILFLIRVDHPPVLVPERLDGKRRVLGYLCLALFVLCFSPQPIKAVDGSARPAAPTPVHVIGEGPAPVFDLPAPGAPPQGTAERIAAPEGGR